MKGTNQIACNDGKGLQQFDMVDNYACMYHCAKLRSHLGKKKRKKAAPIVHHTKWRSYGSCVPFTQPGSQGDSVPLLSLRVWVRFIATVAAF